MFPLLRLLHQYIWAAFCFPHGPDPGEDRGQMISPEPPGPLSSKARGNNTRTGKKKKKKVSSRCVTAPAKKAGSQKPGELVCPAGPQVPPRREWGDTSENTEHKPASPKGSWDLSSFSNEDSRRQPAGDKGLAPPTGV